MQHHFLRIYNLKIFSADPGFVALIPTEPVPYSLGPKLCLHTWTHTHAHICMHTHHLLVLFLIRTLTNTDFDFIAWNICYLGKCSMWSLTEYLILCFWEHGCMSVNWVRMINSFVQVFFILIFSLINCLQSVVDICNYSCRFICVLLPFLSYFISSILSSEVKWAHI